MPPGPRLVVLAAGFSTRMGRAKALVRVRGMTLIGRTLSALAPFATAPIIVVVPPRAARLRAAVRGYRAVLVANRLRRDGLSSSVRCGLRHARYAAAALLVPVDLCHLERRDMARLIARWRGARRRVAARRIGGEAAAPLILPRRLFARARDVVGDVGLKTLVRNLPSSDITLVSLASAGFDVDTAGDLERARRHARPRTSSPGARDQPG